MKEAILTDSGVGNSPFPPLNSSVGMEYELRISQPSSHLLEVTLTLKIESIYQLPPEQVGVVDLKMAVWTPGSYLVREYARHLQNFAAFNGENQPLSWRKVSKNHWQIETKNSPEIGVTYQIFANELTVRTNHIDDTHVYLNPAAVFLYLPDFQHFPIKINITLPDPQWKIATPLPTLSGQELTLIAADFDTLVDSPLEIGIHEVYEFTVREKLHKLVIWGKGNIDPKKMLPDLHQIIKIEADIWGGLPYDEYLFLLHLSHSGYGGLEHKFCCSLNYPRLGFQIRDKYERFMQLVAHEFFHLWNVKRIRPKGLETFDYDGENYTPSLWFSEGTTSYYDLVIPFRAGIFDAKEFLHGLSKEITRLQTIPGRKVQSLSESSWDAWIKLYRRDHHSDNHQISYYLKGEIVSFLLDLLIRAKFRNQRSLDDVLREMWEQFGRAEIGFTPEELKGVIEGVAQTDLSEFFQQYIEGTDELPFNEYLEPFGLYLKADEPHETVFTGLIIHLENGREMVKFVEEGSPAQRGGIDPGDELLALNGFRISVEQFNDRLKEYQPGDRVEITVFHHDELRTCSMILESPRPSRYQIVKVHSPTPTQLSNLRGWLGNGIATIF